MQLGAGTQGGEDIEGRQIEMQGRVAGDPVRRSRPEIPDGPVDEVSHILVGDDDALRHSRRARRKQDVRGVLQRIASLQRRARRTGDVGPRQYEGRGARQRRALGAEPGDVVPRGEGRVGEPGG